MNDDFEPITIRKHADGGWEVLQSDRTAGQLCFGEMLEMVIQLSNPGTPGHAYAMRTDAEWAALKQAREDRLAAILEAGRVPE